VPDAIPSKTPEVETVNRPPGPDPTGTGAPAAVPPAPKAGSDAPAAVPAAPAAGGATAAKIAPRRPAQPRWVPLDVGNQWTYVYLRERSRSRGGEEAELELFRGTLTERVVGNVPEFGPRAVEVRSTVRGHVEGAPAEMVERRRSFVESNGFSYQLLAVEAEDPLVGKLELTRFRPPLLALKAGADVGEKWKIGSKEAGGLTTELEGEILGVQDAKVPSGVFEKCLVVQHTGAFSGAIEVYGNRVEIPSGVLVTTEWYAPGVGKVLVKEEISQTMVLADGSTLDYSERTQFALSSQRSGIAPANDGPDAD
jgi:hypothetical protein